MQQVAIIGAGVAGLAAAQALAQQGVAATVYEKSRGVGGRAATRRVDDCVFDHGAQYVKGPTPELHRLITGSIGPDGTTAADIGRPVWVFDAAGRIAEGDPAQNADPKWSWRSGVTALAKTLAAGCDLRLNQPVARLAAGSSTPRYRLLAADDRLLGAADAVLFTPPAPQTAALIAASDLDPALKTQLLAELERATYRRCISVTAAYLRRPDPPWYALVNSDRQHVIAWLACEHAKAGHAPDNLGLLTAQMAPAWSSAHWDAVAKGTCRTPGAVPALREVHTLVQNLVGIDLGDPLWADVQRWRYALPDGSADFDTLNGTGSGLFFAGDYVTGLGRVHLAIESGWRVATAIAARQ